MTKVFILLGAGFSTLAGLPLVKEINSFFTRNNAGKILKFGSGESKWLDFASETDTHNGRLGFDHIAYGYILNSLVHEFVQQKNDFTNYEDFYQFLNDNLKNKNFLDKILKDAETDCLKKKPDLKTNPSCEFYLNAFINTDITHITSLINHLIADLLYPRKTEKEIYNIYSSFISYVNQFENVVFTTLNHDFLLEYLYTRLIKKKYSDGFSTNQKILFSSEGIPLNTFDGKFKESISIIKLHGSIDIYKYLYLEGEGAFLRYSGEYLYFKTHSFSEKQTPQRYDPETGDKIQVYHSEIKPQFVTGTKKEDFIKSDKMYSSLYNEFHKQIHSSEQIIIIGYSFSDGHVNNQIETVIKNKSAKRIINMNPGIKFPYDNNGIEIVNLQNISEVNAYKPCN